MRRDAEPELGERLISDAVTNYIECLGLQSGSRVLIVTDKLPKNLEDRDTNLVLRRKMSAIIADRLRSSGMSFVSVEFDSLTPKDEIFATTKTALQKLGRSIGSDNPCTTIIYLGSSWDNRSGMYDAAKEYGSTHKTRLAGSLGFTTGDGRVMSQMNGERRQLIEAQSRYFETFFAEHPVGVFDVKTMDKKQNEYHLSVSYDVSKAPFLTDLGWFGEDHTPNMGPVQYINIPSGEKYGPPFPYKETNGFYLAEGILFCVEEGLVTALGASDEVLAAVKEPSQRLFIKLIQSKNKLPLSELGLGFYDMARIEVFSDSSTLTLEKEGPHTGFATDPTEGPESEEMKKISGDFHHTDFVMDGPVITFWGPNREDPIIFYQPVQ